MQVKHLTIIAAAAVLAACTQITENAQLTDALDASAWDSSSWISAKDAPVLESTNQDHGRSADGASWFLTTVENEGKVVSAKWMTAGLGVYELYVNGVPVGDEFLKPGFTHWGKTKRSFTYDISGMLHSGRGQKNVLSAQVTPGWWADRIITRNYRGMTGDKCAFRAVLELTYADGSKRLIGTDTEHWTAGIAGPVTHASIFDGEEYDARIKPGFDTPEKLGVPEINDKFAGEILPTAGAEVYLRHDLTLSPVQAYIWEGVEGAREDAYGKVIIKRQCSDGPITLKPGETLVVDFGQNCAAVPEFVFKAPEGTVLTCLPAELLNDGNGAHNRGMDGPEGSVHRLNLRAADYSIRMVYTFADTPKAVTYHPTRSFFGYRFISVTATDEVTIDKISSIPVSSITAELETGTITTGNELINKLISNTIWGQRSNYLSVPTDCPQRNERLGWTADTQIFAETGTFFANTDAFFHKWMRDMRDSQGELGGFPGVAPLAQYGGELMRLGWADAGVIVPWTIWKQYGDKSIIEESWEAMDKFMNHVNETHYDHNALLSENDNYQWADWVSYEPLESNGGSAFYHDRSRGRRPLPDAVAYWNYLGACYWAIDAGMMRDMAAATGRDAAKYEAMRQDAVNYMKKTFLTPDGRFKTSILNTMQTPALFAMKTGIVSGKALEDMKARLRANFAAHDNCLQTGFLGTSILMDVLTENGMADIAWALLYQRKNPSWLYSVDNGATTIWERWNSYTLESGMGPKGMNSFNHYAYGVVCSWIWKTAAGIAADPAQPGFKHIIMKPIPDPGLGHLEAEYHSAAGLIRSAWHYDGGKWIWNFSIPEGATASVTLPGETEAKEYVAGTYEITR
ncbi:MAG: family 78 glycoside hydrolase catalytic domain [Bacteroidales bacterium]|nr:family 78 glycoside hydrolase catalytic domain [Bacteroidales bacterium]